MKLVLFFDSLSFAKTFIFNRAVNIFCLLLMPLWVLAQPGVTLFEDNFEGGFKPQWLPQPNLTGNNGTVDVADDIGLGNSRAARLGKTIDGDFTLNALSLPINLQGKTDVRITFWIESINDASHPQDGIWFSDNGGTTYKQVYKFNPSDWCHFVYGQYPPFEVDKLAAEYGIALNSQFVFRIVQYGKDDFNNSSGISDGFYIDNFRIYTHPPEYKKITLSSDFFEDFESPDFSDVMAWRFADSTATLSAIPTQPANLVGIEDDKGINNSRGLVMGKRFCDGVFLTNAIDLHFDFSTLTPEQKMKVEMNFWIYSNNEETQEDDGLYFSDDGGINWTKVFAFAPGNWCHFSYGQFPNFQIGHLAAKYGLTLSDKFIIRLQQHGKDDFNNSSGNSDGFVLDNIHVFVDDLAYFPVSESPTGDFFYDFETGDLNKYWAVRFADSTAMLINDPTTPSNIVAVETGIGLDNGFGLKMGKRFCDGGFLTNAVDAHFDFSGLSAAEKSRVEMTFVIQSINDATHIIDDGIYFSDNGGNTWKKVLDFSTTLWCHFTYGQLPPLRIEKLAQKHQLSLTDRFIIRIQQHGDSDFNNSSGISDGFYIDNVHVYVPSKTYTDVPFVEDFETGSLRSMESWVFADDPAMPSSVITTPTNIVQVSTAEAENSQYSLQIGKRSCDGGFLTNAFEIRTNLFGASGVKLDFSIFDNNEDDQIQDGIYFSNDGGATFTKVYTFNFAQIPNFVWTQLSTINVDNLAAQFGIAFSPEFVIRFQQHDDDDFNNSSNNADGYYLDNINISATVPTTATNNFDTGEEVSIYPNPAINQLYLKWDKEQQQDLKPIQWSILDVQGKVLKTGTDKYAPIDLSNITPGILVLQIRSNNRAWQKKVVKVD